MRRSVQRVLGYVLEPEHPGIEQVGGEDHLPLMRRLGIEMQLDLVVAARLAERLGIDIDRNIDLRLGLDRHRGRSVGIFEGKILQILAENLH
jgi:hypothetical protein